MIFIKYILISLILSISSYAGIKDTYKFDWLKKKKKVFVLQNKVHENKGAWHVNLGYGVSEFSDFQDTSLYNLAIGYHFSEEWGLEVIYSGYMNSNNRSYTAIQTIQNQAFSTIPHIVRFKSLAALNILFTPFYGKINTFNKIFYLDWGFGLGVLQVQTEDNTEPFIIDPTSADVFQTESRTGFLLKTQIKWHLNRRFKIIGDFYSHFVSVPEPSGLGRQENKLRQSYDFVLSLGIKF